MSERDGALIHDKLSCLQTFAALERGVCALLDAKAT
jgi:hypothetical protein